MEPGGLVYISLESEEDLRRAIAQESNAVASLFVLIILFGRG